MTGRTLSVNLPEWAVPLLEPARFKGIWGGRGGGKSQTAARMIIAAHVRDPNRSTVCIRQYQSSLRESAKRLLETVIEELGVGDYFEIQDAVILSKRGNGRIIFVGMQSHTAESIKSLEGYDCAWVEEASTLSQTSLDMLRPTIRKEGSELLFTWNPRRPTDPVDFFLRSEQPPNSVVLEVNYDQNPWLPAVLLEEMELDRARDTAKWDHVWRGGYQTAGEARVFKNWRIGDERIVPPPGAVLRFGADWGFSIDPSVMVRCWVEGRNLCIDHEAYRVGCEIVDLPELFLAIPDAEKWPCTADSARPETISHLQKHGFPKMRAAIKGPRSLEEGIAFLQSHDIVVHPRCKHTIAELLDYSYKRDPATGEPIPLLEDKNNHVIDALRYALEGLRRAPPQVTRPPAPALPTVNHWNRR